MLAEYLEQCHSSVGHIGRRGGPRRNWVTYVKVWAGKSAVECIRAAEIAMDGKW